MGANWSWTAQREETNCFTPYLKIEMVHVINLKTGLWLVKVIRE